MKNNKKKPDQRTLQVLDGLNRLGGCGTPAAIFKVMDCSSWGTKTPEATVRQKLQLSRGTIFFSLEKGVWCTKAYLLKLEREKRLKEEVEALKGRVDAVEKKKPVVNIIADGINYQLPATQQASETMKTVANDIQKRVKKPVVKIEPKITPIEKFILIDSKKDKILSELDEYMKGKTGKDATMVILAAVMAGAIKRPSYKSFDNRYPDVINKNHYYDYTVRKESYNSVTFDRIYQHFLKIVQD